jgi:integrase
MTRYLACRNGFAYKRIEATSGQIKRRLVVLVADISDFSLHDCRHTRATCPYAANREIIPLMKLGGWKSKKMVLHYAHINVSHLAQSIDALPWIEQASITAL